MTLDAALKMASENRIEEWIHQYLLQPHPTGNKGLSDGLKLIKRYWIGPVKIDFAQLIQVCGSGEEFEFNENEEGWYSRVSYNLSKLKSGCLPPPMIVEYRNGKYRIADGNHRFASMSEFGLTEYWCCIWFNSEKEYLEYMHLVNCQ